MEAFVRVGRVTVVASLVLWVTTLVVNAEMDNKSSEVKFGSEANLVRSRNFASEPKFTSELFVTADTCMACHNNLISRSGEDVSIFADWRASMMANSARDPYWMA